MRPLPAVVVALFSLPLLAQTPYTEKIEVSVVNIDVTVTDRHGNPVRGLTKDDFEVFDDGAPQPITNFYAASDLTREPADSRLYDEHFRRKVLVLIDTYTTTPFERNQTLERLEQLINDRFESGEYDWSIAALDLELRVLLPPTSDKDAIHRALDQIRANHAPPLRFEPGQNPSTPLEVFARSVLQKEEADAEAERLDAIHDAVRAFGATSGKKIILLLSDNLLPTDWGVRHLRLSRAAAEVRNSIIRDANASNVNLYLLTAGGVSRGDPSMYWIARETGGRFMPGNDVAASLRRFDASSSNFYSLGYRAAHPDDGKYHRIEVRVNHTGYRLQYRDGYASLSDDKQLNRTMESPFGAFMLNGSDLPVTVVVGDAHQVPDGVIAILKTSVPAEQLVFVPATDGRAAHVEISISVFDSTGHNVWHVRLGRDAILKNGEAPKGTFVENTEVELEKGKPYRVVVAVRDEVTDTVGVTQQIVQF